MRMLGQHQCRRLLARGLEIPEKLGKLLPDLHARHLVVAEAEDRAGAPFERQLGAERSSTVVPTAVGFRASDSSIGSNSSSGVPR